MTTVPLSSLSIFPASKEQIIESRTRSFASWGRGTTLEQYLERDARSDNHEVSKDDRLVTWILAPRDSPESLDFLCSCETFLRDGLVVKTPGPSGEGTRNSVEVVPCYGIASVFTPEKNRGKGYAHHMMRLLHWVIGRRDSLPRALFPDEWGSPPVRPPYVKQGAFSALYSDVGPRFYEIAGPALKEGDGWKVNEPTSTLWNVSKSHPLCSEKAAKARVWRWLDKDWIKEAWKSDALTMSHELAISPGLKPVTFTFLPTRGVAEFQHVRLEQFWRNMEIPPLLWGVTSPDLDTYKPGADLRLALMEVSVFASWTLDFRPQAGVNRLIITRLRCAPQNFEGLMYHVFEFAQMHSIDEVEAWGLPHELRSDAERLGGRAFDRDEHLSSFKWYGSEDPEDVSWVYNEKYVLPSLLKDF